MSEFETWKSPCGRAVLYLGDCQEVMKAFEAESIDAVVTDPPYGLKFMGKHWDCEVPSRHVWWEAMRLMKPGAHLLSFFGSRTYHRGVVAIEDAGLEIRDQIMWVYGSGFPKSLDVSKAIDKADGVSGSYGEKNPNIHGRGNHVLHEGWKRPWQDNPDAVDKSGREYCPATDAALQWNGWGTALKPAHEPIVVARKPLIGTVAANVLAYGTGAINVDGCRIGTETRTNASVPRASRNGFVDGFVGGTQTQTHDHGRWPANLIHDGSAEVLAGFPEQKSGEHKGLLESPKQNAVFGKYAYGNINPFRASQGNAARFFYCAKSSKADRDHGLENHASAKAMLATGTGLKNNGDGTPRNIVAMSRNTHATVKPVSLMRYLCRLITPPGGTILDPYAGSGSTGKAALLEGFNFIGIEREPEYFEIAKARIIQALADRDNELPFAEPDADDVEANQLDLVDLAQEAGK